MTGSHAAAVAALLSTVLAGKAALDVLDARDDADARA